MFITLVLICGTYRKAFMGCEAHVNQNPHRTLLECEADRSNALAYFATALPDGLFISDAKCVAVSVGS